MYKTRLPLVEPTKILERASVDNLRFINPLGHDYASGAYSISPEIIEDDANYLFAEWYGDKNTTDPIPPKTNLRYEVYHNLYDINFNFNIYKLCYWTLQGNKVYPTTITLLDPNGREIYSGECEETTGGILDSLKLNQTGYYKLIYEPLDVIDESSATYTFYVLANPAPKKPYTITEVIERILNAGLGAWNGYYKLDPVFAEKWKDVPAPEFEITGKTLYEALLMVCGYKDIQAIPRLKPTPGSAKDWEYNFITFDLLNENEEWTPPSGCIAKSWYWDGESYCGGLDSYVDNFVDNSANGSIKQAYPMTPRTETSDLVIDDGHAIIKTKSSIYSVQNVEQAYINDDTIVGGITPYIFEKSEYDNLTSYTGTYPTAKQFAFYYIQGQPNLYGLVLKPETATDIGAKLTDMAAIQIAEKKSGQDASLSIANFAYKVTYTPMSPRRIRQVKPTRGFSNSNTLYYNQSANIVESKNYGGRMKGELARIGNKVELETYRLYKLADMPKAGMKKDGKYISQVDWEIQLTSIKVTIHLVKNYNRLSEYVGINSLQRFYEVSERQATERQCNFSYISQIGKSVTNGNSLVTPDGVARFADTFRNTITEGENNFKIAFVIARAYSKDGTQIESPTIHEVSGNGIGNSMSFYFAFQDNYSAGEQAVPFALSRKLQKSVPYGDEYGEFYELQMDFYGPYAAEAKTAKDQLPANLGGTGFCDALPEISTIPLVSPMISYRRVIDKNSGEKISVETQIHFQSNDENVIIGTALGEDNLLVAGKVQNHTYVCLPYEIEQLQERIPLEDVEKYKITGAFNIPTVTVTNTSITLRGIRNRTEKDALSWACVNEQGNILIARNESIKIDERSGTLTQINFNLTID